MTNRITRQVCVENVSRIDKVVEVTPGVRPLIEARINGSKMPLLWDSGSTVSLLRRDMLASKYLRNLKDIQKETKFVAANGSELHIMGSLCVTIEISWQKVRHPFLILDNLRSVGILGTDFMEKIGASMDFEAGGITSHNVYLAPFISGGQEAPIAVTIASHLRRGRYVRSRHVYHVTPMSEVWINMTIEGPSLEGETVVCEAYIDPRTFESLICVDTSVCKVSANNRIRIKLGNPTNDTIVVKRGQPLLIATSIATEEIFCMEDVFPLRVNDQDKKGDPVALIDLSHLDQNQRKQISKLLQRYRAVLSRGSTDVGHCKIMPQRIILQDKHSVACTPPYRIPEALKSVVNEYVDKLLLAKVIQKSVSPFSSPLMLVKKPNSDPKAPLVDQYRVVNDFRKLNALTVKDSYPMRNLYELLDEVANAQVVSVLDLKHSFWAQELTPESRPYTSFPVSGRGLFEFTRSAQGLVNSSNTFQRLLDYVLRDVSNVQCYIDDLVIYSNSWSDHLRHLEGVLARLIEYGLKCSPQKVQIAKNKISYLGFDIIPGQRIEPGSVKVAAIEKWPPPDSVTGIRQFLGLCSFFRRVIPNFASVASPLSRLTRKDSEWKSGELPSKAKQAFHKLKSLLVSRPCLKPVDFSKEFILTTDASTIGLGAMLTQKDKMGNEYAVAYASRALNDRESQLAPFHLEHMAMTFGCKHFRPYLTGRHFVLRTDHKPLVALNKVQNAAFQRLQHELEEYQPFTIEYLKGSSMMADGLSRIGHVHAISSEKAVEEKERPEYAVTLARLQKLQRNDPLSIALYLFIMKQAEPSDPSLLADVRTYAKQVVISEGLVYYKRNKAYIPYAPRALQQYLLTMRHEHPVSGHFSEQKMYDSLSCDWWWPSIRADIARHCHDCKVCNENNPARPQRPAPLGQLPPVSDVFQRVHMDLLTLPRTPLGFQYVLVLIDAYTKWIELVPLRTKTAAEVATAILHEWILRYGPPLVLISDQGKEFHN